MDAGSSHLKMVLILTIGFTFASILGYISQRLKLSPILGYLLAGFLIGPYSPGFVADLTIAEQLAEIGVILMMFGVGLHFKWEDLIRYKNIAIPGAFGQTFIATVVTMIFTYMLGWSIESGIIMGLAVGVASTVVLVRVLTDNNLFNTPQGHITVGWLIVEDLLTVIALILLPALADSFRGGGVSFYQIGFSVIFALFKFALLALFLYFIGRRIIKKTLFLVARARSHELFTLSILALIFLIATGSALIFGTSIALGAFVAGMAIGTTEVKYQASANALPMKDAFVVIFFLAVGMLFSPSAIAQNPILFLGILFVVLVIKPLAAIALVLLFRHPMKVAITVALGLAQIGEFSFILGEEAMKLNIFPDEGYDVIVACAIVSISLNPLWFKFLDQFESFFGKQKMLPSQQPHAEESKRAIVVGFGPIGQSVTNTLKHMGLNPVIIDWNVDTVAELLDENIQAIYGDASHEDILKTAHIQNAKILVITVPNIDATRNIIITAREMNPSINILARARFTSEQQLLEELKVYFICCEEEAIKSFNDAIVRMNFTLQ